MLKKGSFSANFLMLFSGNTIAQIVPFFFAPIITRLFLEEELAIRGNFLALTGMLAVLACGRYEMAIVLPTQKSKAMQLFSLASRICFLVSICSIFFYLFRQQVDSFYNEGKIADYLIFLLIAVPLYGFTNIFTQWLIREKKYKELTSSGIARSAFINLFTVLFGYASFGVLGLILGTLIGMLISLVIMIIPARKTMDFSLIESKKLKQVAIEFKDFPKINAPHAFVDILFTQFILFAIITREYGLEALAYFYMMFILLIAGMKAVGGAVGQLYYKEASDLISGDKPVRPVLIKSIKIIAVFAIPLSLLVLFFGPQLFAWYLGNDYVKSGELAQIMILPLFINFIISPISSTPIIYRKQKQAFLYSLIGYTLSILAFVAGNYFNYSFSQSLLFYALVQTLYYLWLFVWYYQLSGKNLHSKID